MHCHPLNTFNIRCMFAISAFVSSYFILLVGYYSLVVWFSEFGKTHDVVVF